MYKSVKRKDDLTVHWLEWSSVSLNGRSRRSHARASRRMRGAELPAVQRGRVMLFILRRGRHEDKYAMRLVSSKGGKKRKKKGKMLSPGTDPHGDG